MCVVRRRRAAPRGGTCPAGWVPSLLSGGHAGAGKSQVQGCEAGKAVELSAPRCSLRIGTASSSPTLSDREAGGIAYGCTIMPQAKLNLPLKARTWAGAAAGVVLGVTTSNGVARAEGVPVIKVEPAILAQPASKVAMPIQLEPSGVFTAHTFIRLRGLPRSVSLTEGFAIGPGVWAVGLLDLAKLNINVPVDVSGRANFVITLVDVEGTILAEATSALVVGPAVVFAPDREPAESLETENKPAVYRAASNMQPSPQFAQLTEAREERLLGVGERHLAQGNIAAARAFFRRAADAGSVVGATLLATTYDPVELQRLKVLGVVADPTEARKWYGRARELGAPEDPARFIGCK
jgi:hypothetical protein